MEPEQGLDHSEEVNLDDIEKLKSLMDDNGSMGDVSEAQDEDEPKETAQPQPQIKAPETKTGETPTPQGQAELIDHEYEGKTYKIPAELKDALLRQSDYTRKTQEVAQTRATVEQQRAEVQRLAQDATQFVEHFAAVKQIDNQLQQLQQVDWQQLQATDPLKHLEMRQAWTELTQARQNVLGQVEQSRAQLRHAQESQIAQHVNQGAEYLSKQIPDWGPEKQKALFETAQTLGYGPEEAASVIDPRQVIALHELFTLRAKVAQYEAAQSTVSKQIKAAPPKVVRPSASHDAGDRPQSNEALSRLKRSGSDDDAIAALKHLMG